MPLFYDTPPATNPIDLTELKDHLRIGTVTDYDSELNFLIKAATDKTDIDNPAQFAYRRQFIKGTLIFSLKGFHRKLELPRPPLISVTTVEYRDQAGAWQTVVASNYEVNSDAQPGFIRFSSDYDFPATFPDEEYPVRITYAAGYEGPDGTGGTQSTYKEVPANIRLWIMNIIGDYWEERKSEMITNMELVQLKTAMARLMAPHNAARRFG